MKFHAILTNPKPIGDIDSSGYFGPFNAQSPRRFTRARRLQLQPC